jgi:hypothetical protein
MHKQLILVIELGTLHYNHIIHIDLKHNLIKNSEDNK